MTVKNTILFLLTSIIFTPAHADMLSSDRESNPDFNELYVMLYYKDIAPPVDFYGNVLGLKTVMDEQWVKLFQLTSGSFIGVVNEDSGHHKVKEDNAVTVSIVTDDVDAWYDIVKGSGKVTILKDVSDSKRVPVRSFLVADPGGYTVEFFQWLR